MPDAVPYNGIGYWGDRNSYACTGDPDHPYIPDNPDLPGYEPSYEDPDCDDDDPECQAESHAFNPKGPDFSCPKLEHTEEDLESLGEKAKQKFPFDVFQNMPTSNSTYCPSFSIGTYHTPPACWLNSVIELLRIPFLISFLLWLVFSL